MINDTGLQFVINTNNSGLLDVGLQTYTIDECWQGIHKFHTEKPIQEHCITTFQDIFNLFTKGHVVLVNNSIHLIQNLNQLLQIAETMPKVSVAGVTIAFCNGMVKHSGWVSLGGMVLNSINQLATGRCLAAGFGVLYLNLNRLSDITKEQIKYLKIDELGIVNLCLSEWQQGHQIFLLGNTPKAIDMNSVSVYNVVNSGGWKSMKRQYGKVLKDVPGQVKQKNVSIKRNQTVYNIEDEYDLDAMCDKVFEDRLNGSMDFIVFNLKNDQINLYPRLDSMVADRYLINSFCFV